MTQFLPDAEKMPLAVAVSGGADSMAACLLAQQWVKAQGGALTALTVDHALRPGSADETERVAGWMQLHGIPHHILKWQGEKPASGMQEAARQARYRLMAEWCNAHDVHYLLTGHHQDDQLETFWLRLLRGSGPFGLAGMSARVEQQGMTVLRPLLETPKAALVKWLREQGQDWLEDPSNASGDYTRNRLRRMLAEEGLDRHRQLQTIHAMQQSRMAEETRLLQAIDEAVQLHPQGYAAINVKQLQSLAQETALRLLSRVLTTVSGAEKPPRMAEVKALYADRQKTTRTLHGCMILPQDDNLLVVREPARMQGDLPAEATGEISWDGRFMLHFPSAMPGRRIMALQAVPDAVQALHEEDNLAAMLARVPKAVLPTLPVITDRHPSGLEAILAVPHIGYYRNGRQEDADIIEFTPRTPLHVSPFRVLRA